MNKKIDHIHFRSKWGLWWPNYDLSPERTYAYVQKHIGDVDMTIRGARHHRVCIQAGGHVGLWPLKLSRHFDRVITFEPDPDLFQCLRRNTADVVNIICVQAALGPRRQVVRMRKHEKAGSSAIDPAGDVLVNMDRIDDVMHDYDLEACDALILDIEGSEVEALKGAEQAIAHHWPVIHVEELRAQQASIAAHMASISYREIGRAGRDALYQHGGETC